MYESGNELKIECDDHMCYSICPNCGEQVVINPIAKTGSVHCCKTKRNDGTMYCLKLGDKNV